MYLKRMVTSGLFVFSFLLAGCGGLQLSVYATPTGPGPATTRAPATTAPTGAVATTVAPTEPATAVAPTEPATAAPPTEPATAAPPTAAPTRLPPPNYLDDRSSAVAVLESLVNALNRKEYARAYGYWEANSGVAPFAAFEAGYSKTESVELTTGPLGSEGAAGSLYYTVAATLRATLSDGGAQTFVGCYTLRLAQPAVQGTPPFNPLAIHSATLKAVAAGADTAALMAAACPPPAVSVTPGPTPLPGDVSATYYIDNRSDPVAVLNSLFNAINRHEFLRAYSYWESGSKVGSFPDFEAGYASTASVALATGQPASDQGAGQIYYLVPVTLHVQTTSGQQQIFVGCYNLHLSNPGIQTVPPFMPMAIRAARVQRAASDASATALMATACATPPQ